MKTNKKRVQKVVRKVPTTAELVNAISLDEDCLAEVKYCTRGCFIPIYNGVGSDIETCRESARYRYYEESGHPSFFMGFYHPVKKGMTLSKFLSQFDEFFGVKNEFFDLPSGITVLREKGNFWMESDIKFEVLTLLARSFHVINDPRVTSLEQWARRVKGQDLLSDDVVEFIVNFKKLSKLDFTSVDLEDFGGLVDFIESEEYDSCGSLNFKNLLIQNLSIKDLVKVYVR